MMKMKSALAVLLSLALAAGTAAYGTATAFAASGYSADGDNEHAIEADGKTVSYSGITVSKTGDGEGDDADFYGENAAVFATNGAALTISDAKITTSGKYANAVFSYGEGTTINISDSTIKTSQRNSGGIMVTGGGTLNASNLTVVTEGGSSAAIRSDRGGGTMNVDGGSYTANGSGSPAIYSTADITVSNATLNSGSAQAVVVEGGNKVTLKNCTVTGNNTVQNSDKSDYYQAVMLYQSMSGDASEGSGSFTMDGGSLSSLNGGMFFVTNAAYTINLTDVDMSYANGELLRICAAGWGDSGSNGGQVTLNADDQELEGSIIVDEISALNMYLADGSSFTGAFENEGEVYLEISKDSSWTLTADSSITSLSCQAGSIDLNGYTLTVGGKEYTEGSSSTGTAIEFTVSQGNGQESQGMEPGQPGENNNAGQMPGNGQMPEGGNAEGQQPPEMPEEGQQPQEMPEDGQQPQEMPEEGQQPQGMTADGQQPQGNVPEKPGQGSTMNKPENGSGSGMQSMENLPEKPNDESTMEEPESGSTSAAQPQEEAQNNQQNNSQSKLLSRLIEFFRNLFK